MTPERPVFGWSAADLAEHIQRAAAAMREAMTTTPPPGDVEAVTTSPDMPSSIDADQIDTALAALGLHLCTENLDHLYIDPHREVTVAFRQPPSSAQWEVRIPIDGADTIGGPRRRTPRPA